jgi:sortase A
VRRKLALVAGIGGVCLVAYGAAILIWRDPATDLYTRWEQHKLAAELEALPRAAKEPQFRARRGHALGRISIPRIGLRAIFVEGTRASDLRKGPGHYEMTALPGSRKTIAIAGHRTTFGAPFRHIDDLTPGDKISLTLSYGQFDYRVFSHAIVDKADWSIIRRRRAETLVLSACHPLYNAAQRWVVFARLDTPDSPRAGRPSSRRDHYGSSDVPAGAVAPAPKPSFAARTTSSS